MVGAMVLRWRVSLICSALMLLLAACAGPQEVTEADLDQIDFESELETCCSGSESYPTSLVNFAETNSIWVVPFSRGFKLRESHLQNQPDAQAYLLDQARPLDLVMISNRSRLSGASGEGYFGHVAVYTGDEADLKALGVWNHPAVARFHQRIRAGGISIEAINEDVHLSNPRELMEADAAALFRPTGLSRARRREATIALFDDIGRPFDIHFDLEDDTELYCSELIHRLIPELNMPVRMTYGRPALWPDETVVGALTGETRLTFVDYIYGNPASWTVGSRELMSARIVRAWPSQAE